MLKITFDTNCIINFLDRTSRTATSVDEISQIISYGFQGVVDIKVTTRVRSDIEMDLDQERALESLRRAKGFPMIGTVVRADVSLFNGGDFWGSDETVKLQDELWSMLFPSTPWPRTEKEGKQHHSQIMDIDHLIGHLKAGQDIFVTDDKGILKRQDILQKRFGLRVMSPKECLEEIRRTMGESGG